MQLPLSIIQAIMAQQPQMGDNLRGIASRLADPSNRPSPAPSPYKAGAAESPLLSPWRDPDAPDSYLQSEPWPMQAPPPPMEAPAPAPMQAPQSPPMNPDAMRSPQLEPGVGVDPMGPEDWGQMRNPAIPQSGFDDARQVQTADMSGIKPSGVGEENQLNALARSYQGMMKSLDDYEKMFSEGGSTMWPGARKDALDTAHRDLQMQMKELYNLGVLNGPDLDLMNQILLSPTSVGGNIMDAVGIADMEKRILDNIANVRRMMRNRTEPALQQLGMSPDQLEPKKKDLSEMSDDELLKLLTGGG